jgi:transcriptional regulator with XRE-family HTH domain
MIPTWTRGERMAKARTAAGLDQVEMGERFGVSDSTISSWETEKHQPRDMMGVLKKWAQITDVPLGWLLDLPEHHSGWIEEPALPLEYVDTPTPDVAHAA